MKRVISIPPKTIFVLLRYPDGTTNLAYFIEGQIVTEPSRHLSRSNLAAFGVTRISYSTREAIERHLRLWSTQDTGGLDASTEAPMEAPTEAPTEASMNIVTACHKLGFVLPVWPVADRKAMRAVAAARAAAREENAMRRRRPYLFREDGSLIRPGDPDHAQALDAARAAREKKRDETRRRARERAEALRQAVRLARMVASGKDRDGIGGQA